MLTPKVNELTRGGSPWILLSDTEASSLKRPAAVFSAGR
jgi:hypothetical protein